MSTPGARERSKLAISGGDAFCISADASIVETALPIERFSVSPAVPVTTIWSSATALVCRRKSIVWSWPAVTVIVRRVDA